MSDIAEQLRRMAAGFKAGFFNKDQANDFSAEHYSTACMADERITELEAELSTHQWMAVSEQMPDSGRVIIAYNIGRHVAEEDDYCIFLVDQYVLEELDIDFSHWRYITPPAIETE